MEKMYRKELYIKIRDLRGIWFHIIGIICLGWFVIRVFPAPYRSQYPCQQISITVALGYIAFWSGLFLVFSKWLRKVKFKSSSILPAFIVFFIIIFSISGMVFAGSYFKRNYHMIEWEPVYKDPIGTPLGVNPGRVVWVWNPDATDRNLDGYWWENENNNLSIIYEMISSGIKELSGETDEYLAWDALFRYFNRIHGREDIGYEPGEKISIKINMNNCYGSYSREDNDRDAHPLVVKSIIRHLVNVVGVAQEDITVYDATRPIADWFYNRVLYEEFPSSELISEFPDINFIDSFGGATGRQKISSSTERIYFADGTNLYRTLPICVVEADYIMNIPLLKRHPLNNGNGVTLSGKNMFGTWIEDVASIHNYHESGHILDNPTPQTDLLAHEQIGGKTFLYVGDGLFGTRSDHRIIGKFQMYPFNDDWTNSLFFSQDPVGIDSVMYDFLKAEGTNPSEGSQNYLHQAADPPSSVYDPENDGEYLINSLGVHEHWDTSYDVFSSTRYSGPDGNGIDYVAIGNISSPPSIPLKPQGPQTGKIGVEYLFSTSAIDPENNDVYYMFEWGDNTNSGWIGPYDSGSLVTVSNIWSEKGIFDIRVKAKDEYSVESQWSDPLSINIPKNKLLTYKLLPRIINIYIEILSNYKIFEN